MSNTAPAFDAIRGETGIQTADGVQNLWTTLTQGLLDAQTGLQIAKDRQEPKVLTSAPVANTDNMPLNGASVVYFNGTTAFNLTGLLAPDPGKARIVLVYNGSTQIITLVNSATSTASNQLVTSTGANFSLKPAQAAAFIYLNSKWRQIWTSQDAWTNFTVTYTGITMGNASVAQSRYIQLGKVTVVEGGFVFGNTTTVTGSIGLSALPTSNLASAAAYEVGSCTMFDSSSGQLFPGKILTGGATTATFYDLQRPMIGLTAANPFVWTTSDQLYWRLVYQEL